MLEMLVGAVIACQRMMKLATDIVGRNIGVKT